MIHYFQYQFLLRCFIACSSISIICPVLGNLLVMKRMSLMGDVISHAILPGVAIGFVVGGTLLSMLLGGVLVGIIIAGLISWISYKN